MEVLAAPDDAAITIGIGGYDSPASGGRGEEAHEIVARINATGNHLFIPYLIQMLKKLIGRSACAGRC